MAFVESFGKTILKFIQSSFQKKSDAVVKKSFDLTSMKPMPEHFSCEKEINQICKNENTILKDKVVLITGGVRNLGLAYATELLCIGAKAVMLSDSDVKRGKKAVSMLSSSFGSHRIAFIETDVKRPKHFENAFNCCLKTFDGIDILINNADVFNDCEFEKEIDVNCTGLTRGTLLGLQFMGKDKCGAGGIIINIASVIPFHKPGGCPIYSATKYFVIGLGMSLGHQNHFERTGVKILTLCPGIIERPTPDCVKQIALDEDNYGELLNAELSCMSIESKDTAVKSLIYLLQEGETGSIWVAISPDKIQQVMMPEIQQCIRERICKPMCT